MNGVEKKWIQIIPHPSHIIRVILQWEYAKV